MGWGGEIQIFDPTPVQPTQAVHRILKKRIVGQILGGKGHQFRRLNERIFMIAQEQLHSWSLTLEW
jgi:hypothetical protein